MDAILNLLTPSETILPSDETYTKESQPWSAHKNKNPQLVARPETIETLSKLLKILNDEDIDFAVRGGGCGSASSEGVLISMSAFNSFSFHPPSSPEKEGEEEGGAYVIAGSGQKWGAIDQKLSDSAPGYSVVSARCTYVGVGGGTLQGGLSWMSSEYGLSSDPDNMLDAQIVLMDGTVKWASEDPELLWALRGGGGRFGVVTAFKFRAYRYPTEVYSGMILFGQEALPVLAKAVVKFAAENTDPKVAMNFYCLNMSHGGFVGKEVVPGLGLLVYDANGEEHGRNEAFKWALEIPGAVDTTKGMSYREVNQLSDNLEAIRGQTNQMFTAVVIPTLTEDIILRAFGWFDETLRAEPKLAAGSIVLIELMQKDAFQHVSRSETGWPRPRGRHILQFGTGALNANCTPEVNRMAAKSLADGVKQIYDKYSDADCLPRDFEGFHNPVEMFGENAEKLRNLKKRVDPKNRLRGAYEL